MNTISIMRAVLVVMLVTIAGPAHAVFSDPVFWGQVTVQNDKKHTTDGILSSGDFFGEHACPCGVGAVRVTNYTGPDTTAVAFWKPGDKNWDNNMRVGDVVDISATGQFGLNPSINGLNVWTVWNLDVLPFVAHEGLNVSSFSLFGTVVGPDGFHYEVGDVGYYYGYFGTGTATIDLQAHKKKLDWERIDYTLSETYKYAQLSSSVQTISNPEPSTLILMASGILLLLRRQFNKRERVQQ